MGSLTARLLTMKVGIESFVTHFIDFLHIIGKYMIKELLEVCSRVDVLQLLLVQIQHFVDSPLELELKGKTLKVLVSQETLCHKIPCLEIYFYYSRQICLK